ncbi:glutamate receptor 2.2 [Rhynchospora pubera]|uniref:Glutamate receptor 2.2 n=1 Tax=Rhynchospora pubera TaxID=906938 RepID=A0AAV8CG01_9POAL|nr:glutamate receptor 2.2 [Rhynchospora pubera]
MVIWIQIETPYGDKEDLSKLRGLSFSIVRLNAPLLLPMEKPTDNKHFACIPKTFVLLLFLCSSLVLNLQSLGVIAQNATFTSVRVGVVLNFSLPAAMKSRTSLSMAIEDFYAANPNYSTRVSFDFRDSMNDTVAAVSAAVDLLTTQVEAIIGPQTSAQTNFMAYLCNRAHVPLISFSATSPSISPAHLPYFIRATLNDSSQSFPIAAFVHHFGWRAVVPVYEDSDYGSGIIPSLVDALQAADARIPDRSVIPITVTDEHIEKELYRLMNLPTRVFLVHMLPSLASRLFKLAAKFGMLSDGYVWMVTDSVGDVLEILDPNTTNSMQGVIGFRPYVPNQNKIFNFSARFKARYQKDYPGTDVTGHTIFQLRAYDAAWALAKAVEMSNVTNPGFTMPQGGKSATVFDRLGVSQIGTRLLDAIHNTTFDGLAGNFSLVDGQLQLSAYEIVNVIGKGLRNVGFWTLSSGLTSELGDALTSGNNNKKLNPIQWPGDSNGKVPRGWLIPTKGKKLRIAVPVKHGFFQFVQVTQPISNSSNVTGYCIDVFDAVIKKLPYKVDYHYVPFKDSSYSYNNLVYQVYLNNYDVVVGDTTILANRTNYVDFTLPYTESGVSMVVPIKKDTSKTMWIFLQPLTAGLWLTSLAFFFFTGLSVWVIEHRINTEFRGTMWKQIGLIFYFSFSTLVFAHKEKLESNLSRFLVIVWVFFVLILTSSYTASLTSMLTVQQLTPTITDVNELLRRGDYIGYQDGSFVVALLKRLNFDTSKMRNYSTVDQYAEALAKGSANGGVAAIFDEIPYLKVFLSKYCANHTMVGPTYKTDGFGFTFPRGSPLVADVSRAILNLTEGEHMMEIENRWFNNLSSCPSHNTDLHSSSLSFRSFAGLFIITGAVSVLMLLIFIGRYIYKNWDKLKKICKDNDTTAEILREISKHYDRMESSVRPVPNEENRLMFDGIKRDEVTLTPVRENIAIASDRSTPMASRSTQQDAPTVSTSTRERILIQAETHNLTTQGSDGQTLEVEQITQGR